MPISTEQNQHIVLDVDRTTFNTDLYLREIIRSIACFLSQSDEAIEAKLEDYCHSLTDSTQFSLDDFIDYLINNLFPKTVKTNDLEENDPNGIKQDLLYFIQSWLIEEPKLIFPDALVILKELRQLGFRIIFWSQGETTHQEWKLSFFQRDGSHELALIAPDKLANDVIECIPPGAVVVDDKLPVLEQLATIRSDLQPVWLDRKRNSEEVCPAHIHHITDLNQLMTLLEVY